MDRNGGGLFAEARRSPRLLLALMAMLVLSLLGTLTAAHLVQHLSS